MIDKSFKEAKLSEKIAFFMTIFLGLIIYSATIYFVEAILLFIGLPPFIVACALITMILAIFFNTDIIVEKIFIPIYDKLCVFCTFAGKQIKTVKTWFSKKEDTNAEPVPA